jgi:hypothetical protein
MILFFNWKNLEKEANSNPTKMLQLLKVFYNDGILKAGQKAKLKGYSFLLNPDDLFKDKSTDILYIYQYLFLAAKRDYSLYKVYGVKYLPLAQYTDIDCNLIKHNPILQIDNKNIFFKYEEIKNGISI